MPRPRFWSRIDLFIGYWYSSNRLPDMLEDLPEDSSNPRPTRRASDAVIQAAGFERYVNFPVRSSIGRRQPRSGLPWDLSGESGCRSSVLSASVPGVRGWWSTTPMSRLDQPWPRTIWVPAPVTARVSACAAYYECLDARTRSNDRQGMKGNL